MLYVVVQVVLLFSLPELGKMIISYAILVVTGIGVNDGQMFPPLFAQKIMVQHFFWIKQTNYIDRILNVWRSNNPLFYPSTFRPNYTTSSSPQVAKRCRLFQPLFFFKDDQLTIHCHGHVMRGSLPPHQHRWWGVVLWMKTGGFATIRRETYICLLLGWWMIMLISGICKWLVSMVCKPKPSYIPTGCGLCP